MSKLILSGHSFGGVTAFATALSTDVDVDQCSSGDNKGNKEETGNNQGNKQLKVSKTKVAAVVLLDPANQWMPDHLADALDKYERTI